VDRFSIHPQRPRVNRLQFRNVPKPEATADVKCKEWKWAKTEANSKISKFLPIQALRRSD